ncbi:MAG: N-acetylmuramoyl-L-alanine amidase, partial [Ruminococcus sp.]|nr:N-acetylmuramoyl-L-alanine amidase [Ruminococcus sp.]
KTKELIMIKKIITLSAVCSVVLCNTLTANAVDFNISDFDIMESQLYQGTDIKSPDEIPVNDSIQNLSRNVIKVMIDPGHYGKYNQSPVYAPYWESEMTWKLSNYLQTELQELGVHADLTKHSLDEDPELNDRGFASKGYDFFVSMHSNAGSSSSDQPLAIVYQDLEWTTIDDTSKEIGQLLATTVEKVMETNQKGIIYQRKGTEDWDRNGVLDDEWYSVLFGSRFVGTPGILLEHSFHTNYRSTLWLYDDNNLKKLAKEEASVIFEYFNEKKLAEMPEDILLGDVNLDNIVDASDASCVLEEYATLSIGKKGTFNDRLKETGDINKDGAIDSSDASEILEFYAYASTQTEETDMQMWLQNK